jgi:transcriptional regulator with XRE-family HTH domain
MAQWPFDVGHSLGQATRRLAKQGDAMVAIAGRHGSPVQDLLEPPSAGGPTVLRILLGAQLRRLREAKRISLEEAGNVIRASHSKISRLETGRVGFKDRDIVDLLTYYGVTDEKERETLRALASRANAPGWWHDYSDVLPNWFEAYVGLEEAASQIRAYEIQFVPGLLQTEDYARAVTMLAYSNPREINRRVGLRIARQATLTKPDPPSLWVVLDEAVLRRPIGGVNVMRKQIRHLIEMSQRPNVTIQVIPFNAGGNAAVGAFSVLRFAEYDLPDVVYIEQLTSAQYLDKRESVESYLAAMERLCNEAATPANSVKTLRAMLRHS